MLDEMRVLAEQLRALHQPGSPLVLPNIWDATSARVVVEAGFPVVATGSMALADSLGYADGEVAPPEEMLAAAARIARVVDVPVTVDVESGYGLAPEDLVQRLVEARVHGYNIEDTDHRNGGLVDAARQQRTIAALRASADAAGVPLVLNARVDVFHDVHGDEAHLAQVAGALDRARRYLDAGADCVYPILVTGPALEAVMTGLAGANVNLLVRVGTPQFQAQFVRAVDVGAARISMGPSLWRTQRNALVALLAELPR